MNINKKVENLVGESNSFLEVLEQVSLLASINKPVLIIGERGTGKELIAARLHFLSTRWQQAYVTLNCASLNDNLLDSELFGHESGAFTGANKKHQGRFERANGGTLFLDELANISTAVQEKLLRVIEYGEFERVGGNSVIHIDTRLICATNEDLPKLVQQGKFRADLLDRLAFDVITLPPLRHRQEDIMILAEHFAISMAKQLGWELFSGFSKEATMSLLNYHWPGNIRELKNVVERSLYRHGSGLAPVNTIIIDPFDSPFRPTSSCNELSNPKCLKNERLTDSSEQNSKKESLIQSDSQATISGPINLKQASREFEVNVIEQALAFCQFNQKKTAAMLGLTYHQLRGYLKKYNILEHNLNG